MNDLEDLEWIQHFYDCCKLIDIEPPKHLKEKIEDYRGVISGGKFLSSEIEKYVATIERKTETAFIEGKSANIREELDGLLDLARYSIPTIYSYD